MNTLEPTAAILPSDAFFVGKSYLVTGAAGFIGSHVVSALLNRGASVVAIDDFNDFYDPHIKELNILPFKQNERFQLYRCDIRNEAALKQIFQQHAEDFRSGGIVHLAARAGVRPSLELASLYMETNVQGTFNLAELAKNFKISRFCFASSSSVYGERSLSGAFKESDPIGQPISPYAATKAMAETLLHTYSHLYGMQITLLRFFTVYGPGQRPDLAIHKFTRLIQEEKPIPVFGNGSSQRDYTYVEDILQGVLAALQYTQSSYEIFNLGHSNTNTLNTLIGYIEETLGKKALLNYQPLQPGDVSNTFADISKAQTLLGYFPQTPLNEGISKFVAWYKTYSENRQPFLVQR